VLLILLRVVEAHLRKRSPGASPRARLGAVSFVHRFGAALNRHLHYHCGILDGVFEPLEAGGVQFRRGTTRPSRPYPTGTPWPNRNPSTSSTNRSSGNPDPVARSSGRRVAPCAHAASDPEISVRSTPVDWQDGGQDGGFLPAAPTCVLATSLTTLAKGLA